LVREGAVRVDLQLEENICGIPTSAVDRDQLKCVGAVDGIGYARAGKSRAAVDKGIVRVEKDVVVIVLVRSNPAHLVVRFVIEGAVGIPDEGNGRSPLA